jgi:hypothetical protein
MWRCALAGAGVGAVFAIIALALGSTAGETAEAVCQLTYTCTVPIGLVFARLCKLPAEPEPVRGPDCHDAAEGGDGQVVVIWRWAGSRSGRSREAREEHDILLDVVHVHDGEPCDQ